MTMRIVALIGFGDGCRPAAAGEPRQTAQVTKTERMDIPVGGTLRLANSIGVLTVEAWHRPFPPPNILDPLAKEASVDVGYRMNIDSFTGDIQATLRKADMMLHLPEEGRYDIHAKSKFGDVNNDFPGEEKRRWWVFGHRIVHEDSPAPHKLDLRVKFGDIVILKTHVPKSPDPLIPASKSEAYE
jgi:hypothetical protein